jgi:hypothetical protein
MGMYYFGWNLEFLNAVTRLNRDGTEYMMK